MPPRFRPTAALRARLTFESLESREVPASFVVDTLSDAGSATGTTLRLAMTEANASTDPSNTITFAAGLTGTIDLQAALPVITGPVSIQGPGANLVTVNGGRKASVFDVKTKTSVPVSISGLTVTGGKAGSGAGVLNEGPAVVTLNALEVVGNSASGVAQESSQGTLNVVDCTIADNSESLGPAGVNADAGVVNIDQCTIADNSGSFGGGVNVGSAKVTIRNSTITANLTNFSGYGAGIVVGDGAPPPVLSSTIVAGNFNADQAGDIRGAIAAGSDHNLIGDGTGLTGGPANGANGNVIGNAAGPIDPGLGLLTYNGSATRTMAPLANSPVINMGVDNGFTTDQRGSARVVGSAADIGAVESPFTAGGSGAGSGSGSRSGSGSGSGSSSGGGPQQDQRGQLNELIIANLVRVFSQPLPHGLALAQIVQIADANGDGFADAVALIGVKAGKKTLYFKLVFDGMSGSGATLGAPQFLGAK